MKLICNKNEFYKLLTLAERNTSKNPTLPTLSAVLLKTLKNRLTIISTNLEVGFEGAIPSKIEEEGEVAPPIKTLISIVFSIPEEEIKLESKNQNLKIISKTSTTNLKCFPIEDFPLLPKIKKENYLNIPQETLTQALRNTLPASATTYTKPELASVYIFSQNKIPLTFVATDSFRLAEQKTQITPPTLSLLLPQKSGQEVVRIFEETPGEVEIIFNKNQIVFQNKNLSFISRLTEGKFPEYQNIIPQSFLTQVVADKNNLINSIRAAGIFSSRLSEVLISVNSAGGILEVKSSNSDTGEYLSSTPAKISGQSLEINFNYHYFLEALQAISSQKVFMGFSGPQKAVLIRGFEESSYLHLVMPLKGV